jgi:hypothetical protein
MVIAGDITAHPLLSGPMEMLHSPCSGDPRVFWQQIARSEEESKDFKERNLDTKPKL